MGNEIGFNLSNELKKHTLSEEEEKKLYAIILNGTPEEQFNARTKLAEGNLAISNCVVQRFGISYNYEDYLQEGYMGVWEAALRFDPSTKSEFTDGIVKFDGYAYWWAQARITRALADKSAQCRIPANKKTDFIMVHRAIEEIEKCTNCMAEELTVQQITDFMNSDEFVIFRKNGIEGHFDNTKKRTFSEKLVREALMCIDPVSLDAKVINNGKDEDDSTETYNFIESSDNFVEDVQNELMGAQMWNTLLNATKTEMETKYIQTLKEHKELIVSKADGHFKVDNAKVASIMGITREYARRLFNKISDNVKTNSGILSLKEYL